MQELNKICKFCNESKELNLFRPRSKSCKQCANKKDNNKNGATRRKLFYKNNKELIKIYNLNMYYVKKEDDKRTINKIFLKDN